MQITLLHFHAIIKEQVVDYSSSPASAPTTRPVLRAAYAASAEDAPPSRYSLMQLSMSGSLTPELRTYLRRLPYWPSGFPPRWAVAKLPNPFLYMYMQAVEQNRRPSKPLEMHLCPWPSRIRVGAPDLVLQN